MMRGKASSSIGQAGASPGKWYSCPLTRNGEHTTPCRVAEAEEEGKTVMECFPGSEMAEEYRKLAEVIYELSKESGEGWKC